MSNNALVSLISRVGFLHIKFSKYVHCGKCFTENQEPAVHETRTQSLGTANIKWHQELYIEKQHHDRYSTPEKKKILQKHEKTLTPAQKDQMHSAFAVRLPEKLDVMAFGQRRERWPLCRGGTTLSRSTS